MTLPKPLVLVADDDPRALRLRRVILRSGALRLIEARTGPATLRLAKSKRPDVILLALAWCDMRGASLIRHLREWCGEPIIVVSASAPELAKVEALEAGADDYVTAPFGGAELLARIHAVLRRANRSPQNPLASVIIVGDLCIDLASRVVSVANREVHLTPIEYKLFALLMKNAGTVIPCEQLLREAWGPGRGTQTESLRVHISQLRGKLERNPARPRYLVTEPSVGYRIRPTTDPGATNEAFSGFLRPLLESS